MRFEIAVVRWRGGRPYQEDSFRVYDLAGHPVLTKGDGGNPAADLADEAVVDRGLLVVVADGMGGHGGGDVASRVASDGFVKAFFGEPDKSVTLPDGTQHNGPLGRLGNALDQANRAIEAEVRERPELGDMGCTLIAGYIEAGMMRFCSVGDSLILRLRERELHRVNADHSYARILEAQAVLSNDASLWHLAHASPDRNAITSALQGRRVELIELDERRVEDGDILLFASDGLETLDYEQVRNFVHATRDNGVSGIAQGLKHAIEHFGELRRQDNTTIVVIRATALKPSQADTVVPSEMPPKIAEEGSETTRIPTAPGLARNVARTAATRPPPAEQTAPRPISGDEMPTSPPRAPKPAPAAAGEDEPSIPRTQVQSPVPKSVDPARLAEVLAGGAGANGGRPPVQAAAAPPSPQAAAVLASAARGSRQGSGAGLALIAGLIVLLILAGIIYVLVTSGLFNSATGPAPQAPAAVGGGVERGAAVPGGGLPAPVILAPSPAPQAPASAGLPPVQAPAPPGTVPPPLESTIGGGRLNQPLPPDGNLGRVQSPPAPRSEEAVAPNLRETPLRRDVPPPQPLQPNPPRNESFSPPAVSPSIVPPPPRP